MTYEVPVRQVFEFPTESLVGEYCLFFMGDDVFTVVDIRHSVSDKQKAVINQDWTVLHFAHASIYFRESPCRYMSMGSETWRGLGIYSALDSCISWHLIKSISAWHYKNALEDEPKKTDCRKNVFKSFMHDFYICWNLWSGDTIHNYGKQYF